MKIETVIPYSWLKTVSAETLAQDEIPLLGNPPPFPWESFSSELAKLLELPHLDMKCTNTQWLEDPFTGLGNDPISHTFSIPPLDGEAALIFPKEELKKFLRSLIGNETQEEDWEHEWDTAWEKDFHKFLMIQGVLAFQKTGFDLSLQLNSESPLFEGPFLCFDIAIQSSNNSFFTRLALNAPLRAAIKDKYIHKHLDYPQGLAENITVNAHVVIGNTLLSKENWANAAPGDFLLLDSCSYFPEDNKGRAVLIVNNTPIFRAKIKDGSLKLLEYPLLQEVSTPMEKEEEEDHIQDQDFEDFETENEEFSEDSVLEEEESIDKLSDDLSLEDALIDDGEAAEKKHPLQAAKELLAKKEAPPLVKPDEIPLTITIELTRIQMSIHQLMQLSPGNTLDLEIAPENGVDLTVNGRCIAKGELLKLGETLGVRILDKA